MSLKEGNVKVYDFTSVGELTADFEKRRKRDAHERQTIVGIKTPVQFSNKDTAIFKMNTTLLDQIKDNFRNLLQTNHGERLGHYDFGANLLELCFELGDESTDTEAMSRIIRTTQKFMPFVVLRSFAPFNERVDNEHTAKIGIRLTYDIPALRSVENQIEVLLYIAG